MLPHLLPLLLLTILTACSTPELPSMLQPYRIDIRQGNYVTQEMVSQLKPGMTKSQVRFALGTPLIKDAFHANRWDYVYRFQPGDGELQTRRLIVFFQDDKLQRLSGDVVSSADKTTEKTAEATATREATEAIGKE